MLIPSTSQHKTDSPADRGLQRLAGAVLIQALQDATSGPRRYREEALDWIHGRSKSGFSFNFCCALLGRSPDDVRHRLQSKNFIPKWDPTTDTDIYSMSPSSGYASRSWMAQAS